MSHLIEENSPMISLEHTKIALRVVRCFRDSHVASHCVACVGCNEYVGQKTDDVLLCLRLRFHHLVFMVYYVFKMAY